MSNFPRPPLSYSARLRSGWIRRGLARVAPGSKILEVGAGQGALGARLARRFDYLGVEADPEAAGIAHESVTAAGGQVLIGHAEDVVGLRTFTAVLACEVLEHIEHDEAALTVWRSWLQPGGHLVLSVPAHPRRFGPADEAVGHYRRYTRRHLVERLGRAGFSSIDVRSYGWPLGYALEAVRNRVAARRVDDDVRPMDERTAQSGRWLQPSAWQGALAWGATLPFRALQWPLSRTEVGTGFVVTARNVDRP